MAQNAAIETVAPKVTDTFLNIVREVGLGIKEVDHKHAVDVEVNFRSVTVGKKGVPLFTKHMNESQLEIKLATRIIPE